MALDGGSGSGGGGGSAPPKPRLPGGYAGPAPRKPLNPRVTTLTPAPPIEVDLELDPEKTSDQSDYSSLLAAYGQSTTPPTLQPGTTAHALAQGYALARGETPDTVQAEQDAEARQVREEKLETRREEKHVKPRRAKEMTWDQYEALSPMQRAAVDFNTELVAAREKDLNADYEDQSHRQIKRYDKAVERLFGEDGGSVQFAPETIAFLDQVDFKAVEDGIGSDLDDFLGLRTAVSAKDLKTFDVAGGDRFDLGVVASGSELDNKTQLQVHLADNTRDLQESMAKAGTLLQDFGDSVELDRNRAVKFYGGEKDKVNPELGWGTDPASLYFRKIYEAFARDDIDPAETWANFNANIQPEDRDAFFRFADTMSGQARDYRLKLGNVEGAGYRKPEEFRKLLGLDEGGGTDAGR
jgi:hypothetical protein